MPRPRRVELRWTATQERVLLWLDRLGERLRPHRTPAHLLTGIRGERAALFELRRRGYIVVASRWTTTRSRGDVDLIAWDGPFLCFVEVKSRTARDLTPANSAVNDTKRRMLRTLARHYLQTFRAEQRRTIPVRFDVVSVYQLVDGYEFDLFAGAFPLSEP
ncbi:MAG: YraN family protein [Acidobacteriota bacterium]|nr:YraN family protein [Acidobacteriota bacterium]